MEPHHTILDAGWDGKVAVYQTDMLDLKLEVVSPPQFRRTQVG